MPRGLLDNVGLRSINKLIIFDRVQIVLMRLLTLLSFQVTSHKSFPDRQSEATLQTLNNMSTRAKKRRTSTSREPRTRPSTRYATRSFMKERQASGIESLGSFFGGLPPEMIKLLVSFLDAPALSSFGSTCRLLRSYTEASWKELCNRQNLHFPLTILCVANPASSGSTYDYDKAIKLCTSEEKWKIAAKRNWLYSRWRCVVCFRNCSSRVDAHFDIALCDTCHPLFYRRKCHAKVTHFFAVKNS